MTQKFALKRLLEIAETTAESAAASLGALNRQLQQHEEKLLLLFKYRDEYQQRLRHAAGSGLDGAGLRNFRISGASRAGHPPAACAGGRCAYARRMRAHRLAVEATQIQGVRHARTTVRYRA